MPALTRLGGTFASSEVRLPKAKCVIARPSPVDGAISFQSGVTPLIRRQFHFEIVIAGPDFSTVDTLIWNNWYRRLKAFLFH